MKSIPTFPLVLCLLGLFSLAACENELAAVRQFFPEEATRVETIRNFETYYSDSAVLRAYVKGPEMLRYIDPSNPRQEFPAGLLMEFYSPNGQVSSRLYANYGIREEQQKRFIVRDSVVWESVGKERLETEELYYDEREGRVYTNKFVALFRPDEIIYGHGFEANDDFSRARIKAIEGKFKIADGRNPLEE
jgi:LPS export ABC transporter protein LptC